MNWELIKHKFCRLAVTASLLLGGVMVSAAASGTMPLFLKTSGQILLLSSCYGVLLLYAHILRKIKRKKAVAKLPPEYFA